MSDFDPETFMSQTVDAPLATEFEVCPEGEYQAMIDDFDSKAFGTATWQAKDGSGEKSSPTFKCPFVIQDESVKASLGRDKVVVMADMFLDVKDGQLDTSKGKNVLLGQIRNAVGQNQAGAWSPSQLRGAGPLMVRVKHRKDKNDVTRAEIRQVAPIK